VRVSPKEVEREYLRRNRTVSTQWVGLRFATVPDDSVQVSDRDLRAYYDDNRDDFERKRTYTLRYVTATKQPAPEDSARVIDDLTRLRPRFAEATDDSVFVARNGSEPPSASTWFSPHAPDPAVATAVFETTPTPGTSVGPFFAGTDAHLIKIQEVRPAEEIAV